MTKAERLIKPNLNLLPILALGLNRHSIRRPVGLAHESLSHHETGFRSRPGLGALTMGKFALELEELRSVFVLVHSDNVAGVEFPEL